MAWPRRDELERLVACFRERTLPAAEWTHHTHLAVGAWHVRRYGAGGALERLRVGIRALNDAHGTPNSDSRGYHETITLAYTRLIEALLAGCGPDATEHECARAVLASPLAARNALLAFYSTERLFSVAARREWLEPDLRPLPPPASPR
jgi:hypothetical protein